jgi:predicted negative regulator of RcsB-dependent stress response
MFIIEFFRVRDADGAHAVLDRVKHDTTDLEQAKLAAQSLFVTLTMPQQPDALRILDQDANEVFVWHPEQNGT